MQISIPSVRYIVFGLFIAFSAVVASVAVWNLTFLQVLPSTTKERAIQVDCFLIFVGCLGLLVAFAILFADLAWRKAFTSRFWFELVWTSLCVLMELAGAIASTVTIPEQTCTEQKNETLSCPSTRILMAFTWMNAVLLLLYSSLLSLHILMSPTGKNPVWLQNIHDLPPFLQDIPASSIMSPGPDVDSKLETVFAPRPVRPTLPISMFSYRSGLSPDYRIEHFQPPPEAFAQSGRQAPHPVVIPESSNSSDPPMHNALYPEYLQPSLTANQTSTHITAPAHREQSPPILPPSTSDRTTHSALGNWPRADIMKRPPERKKHPPESQIRMMDQMTRASSPPSSTRVRPSGPRTSTSHRPRPLDLSRSGPDVEYLG